MRTNVYKEVKEEVEEFKKMKDKEIEAVKKEAINTKEINSVEEESKEMQEKAKERKSEEECKIKHPSIVDQLKGQLEIKTQQLEKEIEEVRKLEAQIIIKKVNINNIQGEISRIEEAATILEPLNI